MSHTTAVLPHHRRAQSALPATLALVCFAVALLVAACGDAPPPATYVWTDALHLDTLSWQQQNGMLSGQDTTRTVDAAAFPASTQPNVATAALSGTLSGSAVTLTISGMPQVSGTLAAGGSALTLAVSDAASGQVIHQTWVAVTPGQVDALAQAFTAYVTARGWLGMVQQETRAESPWSDPNATALATTQAQLAQRQAQLAAIQQAKDTATRCTLAARSIPLAASWFALPFTTQNSRMFADLARFRPAWQAAQRSAVPRVAGLRLPWLLTAQAEQAALAPAEALATRMQAAYAADAQAMQGEALQSRQMNRQVTALSSGCPPMPA